MLLRYFPSYRNLAGMRRKFNPHDRGGCLTAGLLLADRGHRFPNLPESIDRQSPIRLTSRTDMRRTSKKHRSAMLDQGKKPQHAITRSKPGIAALLIDNKGMLGLVFCTAFAARVVACVTLLDAPLYRTPQLDSFEYLLWARSIAEGRSVRINISKILFHSRLFLFLRIINKNIKAAMSNK